MDGHAQYVTLRSGLLAPVRWSVPRDPMIACPGTVPDGGQSISTATSDPSDGNVDDRCIRTDATISFPVSEPGALFPAGDITAAQVDGEIADSGAQISAGGTFTARVLTGRLQWWACPEDAGAVFAIGNVRAFDRALRHATAETLQCLTQACGLERAEIGRAVAMSIRHDLANFSIQLIPRPADGQ